MMKVVSNKDKFQIIFIVIMGFVLSNLRLLFSQSHVKDTTDETVVLMQENTNPTMISSSNCDNKKTNYICPSFEDEMDNLIKSSKQIFIQIAGMMSGSSLHEFSKQCLKHDVYDDFMHYKDGVVEMVSQSFNIPNILVNHATREEPFIDLLKSATDDSLIIYIHREEGDRLEAAITATMQDMCVGKASVTREVHSKVKKGDGRCVVSEKLLYDYLTRQKFESLQPLSCSVLEVIEENNPRMAIIHQSQSDLLQKILAKHRCPELLSQGMIPLHKNITDGIPSYHIHLTQFEQSVVPFSNWMEKKKEILSWSLDLKRHVSCQGAVRRIENTFASCSEKIIKL